jgi:hypothetical protein
MMAWQASGSGLATKFGSRELARIVDVTRFTPNNQSNIDLH